MGIWAHPDDESFMMAGLMAVAAQNGQTVVCITATRGEAGIQNEQKWPAATLGDIRETELTSALKVLKVKHHHWLSFQDGCCCDVADETSVSKITALIKQYQPDTVITFPPDGVTGHWDHIAVNRWVNLALNQDLGFSPVLYYAIFNCDQVDRFTAVINQKFKFYFNVEEPCRIPVEKCDMVLSFSPEIARLKFEALRVMPSQTESMFGMFDNAFLKKGLAVESFVSAQKDLRWASPKRRSPLPIDR